MGLLHYPCMGHSLQLGILKAFIIGTVKTALAHVSNIVSHFQSHICMYQFKLFLTWSHMCWKILVLLDGEVRTYKIFARFIEQQKAVCAVLLEDSSDWVLRSATEFNKLLDILKSFNDATKTLRYSTCSTSINQFLNKISFIKPEYNDVVKLPLDKIYMHDIKKKKLKNYFMCKGGFSEVYRKWILFLKLKIFIKI